MAITDDARNQRGAAHRRATIADVAREAGVSISAVSKVLRNASGVSPSMRAKVGVAIDTLGYRPNAGARAMRGRSYTIGVAMVELSSPFQAEVAQSVGAALEGTRYQEIMIASGFEAGRQIRGVEALLDRQVDGVIIIAPWMPTAWVEALGERIPTVTVGLHGPARHFDIVSDDDFAGAGRMVDHLVSLGHRRIVHTSMPPAAVGGNFALSHTAREEGFRSAAERHGLDARVISTWYSEEGGYRAASEALDSDDPPTAIFAGADIAALGVLRAARERGLRVPEDLTVTGYDNIFAASMAGVELTTMNQSAEKTGAKAASLILERLAGRTSAVNHLITPELVVRATSAPPLAS